MTAGITAPSFVFWLLCVLRVLCGESSASAAEAPPKWAVAHKTAKPMTADETRAFMKRLARYVAENHLKKDDKSPQRGMIYEYFEPARKGQHDQWVQGEARQHPGLWEQRRQKANLYANSSEAQVKAALERELALGLRTWQAVFDELGYIPTGMGEARWQRFSDSGGYAHLLKAAAHWLLYLEDKRDWELHAVPGIP
jgi:hypothetical protein